MDFFYPFIHQIKKKEQESQPLYVEIYPPLLPIPQEEEIKEEDASIVVIEL
jgi:hypothetical protein